MANEKSFAIRENKSLVEVYNKETVDSKLNEKSDKTHTHAWSSITSKPTTFPPSDHTHDSRYYTESEMNTKLAGKSDTGHTHAWSSITSKPSTFTPSAHNHDDRYYTETEMNSKLASYKLKGDFAVRSTDNFPVSAGQSGISIPLPYPSGFTVSNCVVLSAAIHTNVNPNIWVYPGYDSGLSGLSNINVKMTSDAINVNFDNGSNSAVRQVSVKLVLMKV